VTQDEFARGQRGREGPAWRYKTAEQIARQTGPAAAPWHDRALSEAAEYLRLVNQGGASRARASAAYPLIAAAEGLNADDAKTAPLKLMALGELPLREMHARSGVEIAVLDTWELLFFDVRNQRKAIYWLVRCVVDKERSTGDPRFASKLKLALMLGPTAVRGLLDHADGKCLDEADRLFQRRLNLMAKFDAAVEMPIDSEKSRMRFIGFHIQLMESKQRLTLAEQQLAQRCAEACNRHELAKLRLAQAAELRARDQEARLRKDQQKVARAAMKQRRRRELHEHRQEAASRERQALAAGSPLAQLTWATKNAPSHEVISSPPEFVATSGVGAAESHDAHDAAA